MSKKILFNEDWYFSKQPVHTTFNTIKNRSISWAPVSLPHDWLIYDTNHLYETGDGWYLKNFLVSELKTDTRISLRFEGIYMNSTIYVNGNNAGTWKYGYSTFEFDITQYLKEGTNEIIVQVIYESPNSRWYTGAGIYRNVWLKTYQNTHMVSDGIYITTQKHKDFWTVEIDTEVLISSTKPLVKLKLRHSIIDTKNTLITQGESSLDCSLQSEVNDTKHIHITLKVDNPMLWDIKSPTQYQLQSELIVDEIVIDKEVQTFGFRTIEFSSEKGFFLNNNYVKLQGVCQHHDLGCLGAAVNKAALKRQITLLQEMGVNAIRTTHNMPAVEFMELADELGILIVSEAFDMWEREKNTYDYARFFSAWVSKDVASWIRRDRNHPSIIMWSIGNEIYDTHGDARGQELTKMLKDMVLEHDPNSNAFVTIGSNYMPWKNAQKCADIVKLAGYNYAEKYYDIHHKEHPDWIIYGSETASTVQSRGIYHFPLAQSILSDDDEQCSALGNSSTSWGAKNTESCIIADRDSLYSLGQFLWTGFDYIGEPTPYFTKNSYFGQLDTAGFKKDSFYIYQAEWTNYKENPMIHIFPYWDFSKGQLIDVRVCSNAPKIELFFNNISQGFFAIDHIHGKKLLGEWQLPYTKGVLLAIAYDENDKPIAREIKSSHLDAFSLVLTPDKREFTANGSDLIFVEISALDAEGNPVENANNRIHVTIEGPGRLVGLDNGDSTDYEQYKGTSRRLFSGKLLAVIASTLETGSLILKASSKGMNTQEITLQAIPYDYSSGNTCCTALYDYNPMSFSSHLMAYDEKQLIEEMEVPIRKLELVSPQGNHLSWEKTSLPVQVIIHPSNSTYEDIIWRVTNAAGIASTIATIKTNGSEAVITALGDGTVYVRCATKNGSNKIRLYSQLEFHISGLGQAYLSPYEFISSGIYTYGSENLTNGNERGMATARDGESRIGFEGIDFGDYGSNLITLPIFSLDSEEFPIEIWEGLPGEENASLITQVTYRKPTRWNVYQEETYQLPRRLKGITTLCFVLYRKIHLKGFMFKKLEKAYEQLSVLENNQIYGDTFTLTDNAIENIGNNVSMVFENMDFGEKGCAKLIICGHSPLDKNTIHIHFSGVQGDIEQLVDFNYSSDYCEREFTLEPITGQQKVTFIFLPGCRFNFKWFLFQR